MNDFLPTVFFVALRKAGLKQGLECFANVLSILGSGLCEGERIRLVLWGEMAKGQGVGGHLGKHLFIGVLRGKITAACLSQQLEFIRFFGLSAIHKRLSEIRMVC